MTNTIARIFNDHFSDWTKEHGPLPYHYYKAVNAITSCRTEKLGYHEMLCDKCGTVTQEYNSCRNRHCPTCQASKAVAWAKKQIESALPVGYFHVVFTLPSELRTLVLQNEKQLYGLLFRCVKETLTTLAGDKKLLGAKIGFLTILHTWTRQMINHPHVHCIVPAGGIREDKERWKYASPTYLFPVPVMRELFKEKFLALLKEMIAENKIWCDQPETQSMIQSLYSKKWVVNVKKPFANPAALIGYLSLYTHRVAISPKRITSYDGTMVTFWYIDSNTGEKKYVTITAHEFIRRFLLHILPPRFVKIRYYGFLCQRNKKTILKEVQMLLEERILNGGGGLFMLIYVQLDMFKPKSRKCQECKSGVMKLLKVITEGKT